MLFNSFIYLLVFLPVVFAGFFFLNHKKLVIAGKIWLVACSLFFYAYWKLSFLPIILASIIVNYGIGFFLSRNSNVKETANISIGSWNNNGALYRKTILVLGIVFNVGLLGYFKYADFFISNLNAIAGLQMPLVNIVLPLGISFFTFQQIAYIVDSYSGRVREYSFLNYPLFVSFFPQLIAGPIVHHKEMMPQFASVRNLLLNWKNIYYGLFFLAMGLFKKVVVADTFAVWANEGFNNPGSLLFLSAWKTSLSYTIQLYFDFSGYTDMAIGAARLLNIHIPQNFNSPYMSLNIQDFWRRWHITLGRFLRDYIYIPLGGNRVGWFRNYFNLFVTFLIGGIWHGAGWTFVLWGGLHGAALCIHRAWGKHGMRIPKIAAWFLTFMFVNAAWVVFRADSIHTAIEILKTMATVTSISAIQIEPTWYMFFKDFKFWALIVIFVFALNDVLFRNVQTWADRLNPKPMWTICISSAFVYSIILMMNQNRFTEFIYFQF